MTCTRCNERPAARMLLFTFRLRIGDERAERQGMCDECTELAVAEYVEAQIAAEDAPDRSQVAAAIVSYDLTGRQWYDDPVLSKAKKMAVGL